MRNILSFFLVILAIRSFSQNKQVLYDFAELPQTLLLNPGAETNYKYHIGVPFLSGISMELGTKGFVLSDIFSVNKKSINQKIAAFLKKTSVRDHAKIDSQIEILSGGFRYDAKTYFSFGFYEKLSGIAYNPKDILNLLDQGNTAFINKSFYASQLLYKLDALGVLHAGITRKISDKLTIGGRFKIYSSAINAESTNNTGSFTTNKGNNTMYVHYLRDININIKTAGFIKNNKYIDDSRTLVKNTFLGGNLGIGLDFGVTYHISKQLKFTGSILDVGFIHYKKNIKNTKVKGDFVYEGIPIVFNTTKNSWQELTNSLKEQLPSENNKDSYVSWRPTKINAGLKYSFGKKRSKYCYDHTYKDFYTNAIGVQLFSIFRPLSQQFALTGFYEKSFSNKFHAKITYTVDDYSFSNIGFGVSTQLWNVNFYGIVDNLAQFN
ncbi:MAG: DUF5723 family protein, partial [Polaribacter sp.]